MISNYNLSCDYHNFELKDKIYLIPDYALKVIYTDGFNEVVFSGNTTNMTILEGYDINFQEESSFDERFRFSKSVSIKVDGYVTFNDLYNRYCVIIETKEGEFYLVNVDFPSYVTHTYTLNNGTNSTELVFSSQSNIAALKLTNFSPNNVNSCKQYSNAKIKNVKLTEAWASYLSTWQKSLVNKGEFVDIEPLPDSISLTEEFDGEKYTVTLGFDIPMSYYKNDWHIKLLQFEENKYRGYIELEDGNVAFVGYNVGLFPSYTINGDIISIRLAETAIRGIAYGNDYAIINTDIPDTIEYDGASCYTYNWNSTCDWHVEDKPDYITITPSSGKADTDYELEVCNTMIYDVAVSEFIVKACNARARATVIVNNYIKWEPSGTTCAGEHGVDKYVNAVKMRSDDEGETWYIIVPVEYSATTLISANSPDCGYAERWVESGYTCINCDKYQNNIKLESYDSGVTWHNTEEYSASTLIETDSDYCKEYRTIQSGDSYCFEGDEWALTVTQVRCGDGEWQYVSSAETIIDDDSDKCTYYLTFKPLEECTFGFIPLHYRYDNYPEYSINHGEWTLLNSSATTISANVGDEIRWRCDSVSGHSTTYDTRKTGQFYSTGRFNAEGYVSSMLYGKKHLEITEAPDQTYYYRFADMFSGNTGLTDASDMVLSITDPFRGYYMRMFADCTNLIGAPDLSNITGQSLYNCQSMFSGCTSLETAPNFPSVSGVSDYAYSYMFKGCTSLKYVPDLSASAIGSYAYTYMFSGCTSLETAPNISATTFYKNGCDSMFKGCTALTTPPSRIGTENSIINSGTCLSMFSGCTSLVTAPELPSVNLRYQCYNMMFSYCTSLTKSPLLPATTLTRKGSDSASMCYADMFWGCSSLNEITCLLESGGNYYTSGWVDGVASTGTFYKNPNRTWVTGTNGVPSGWTVVDYS